MQDIKGYENLYKIDMNGNIFSCKIRKIMKSFLTKGRNGEDKYKRISLSKNRESKKFMVHRLVAQSFIKNPKKFKEVNHINGNKLDNRSTNLEWCSRSENTIHSYKNKLQDNKGIKFSNNTSGYVGVTRCGKMWKAQIRHNKKLLYLGVYKESSVASKVYQEKLKELKGNNNVRSSKQKSNNGYSKLCL